MIWSRTESLPSHGAVICRLDNSRQYVPTNECNKAKGLQWVIDMTVAYPNARPMDIQTWIFGYRDPTVTHVHYRSLLQMVECTPQDDSSCCIRSRSPSLLWTDTSTQSQLPVQTCVYPLDLRRTSSTCLHMCAHMQRENYAHLNVYSCTCGHLFFFGFVFVFTYNQN
ncbi:Acyl-CoA:lysophosphatidylglycerol acyltransferase 1 [Anabarilius grahami]|uniref:Acyl-CoA:lysophosphatidylglycerol acyltransferase 1 n=1 Tax=Anabarilius grahami TaxID=495550 RepID=A0A3N0ZAK1_ANAGA|nr:Acyl-CoA:lysophosphatidylglycerol acyltransferase 1 [Anabarilius grahami]